MKRVRLLLSLLVAALLTGLVGCDVAVVALLASKGGSSKSSNLAPPAPDPRYQVFGATLTPGTESTERNNIVNTGGVPGSNWAFLGASQVTEEFPITGTTNALLILTTTVQDYDLDAVEAFDTDGHLVGTFSVGSLFFDGVTNDPNIPKRADGKTALASATAGHNAFVFQIFPATATPIAKVRVYIKAAGSSQSSGDPIYISGWTKTGDQEAGGAAVNSVGTLFVGAVDVSGRAMWIAPFNQAGVIQTANIRNVETGVAATEGSISVAVDSLDNVIVANTSTLSQPVNTSSIRVRKFDSNVSIPAINDTGLAGGKNRVEAHGVTVDDSDNVIVAAGNDVGTVATPKINHWLRKYTSGLLEIWTQTAPADLSSTWWHGVATGPRNTSLGDTIVATGDLTSSALGPIDIFARKTDAGNTSTTDSSYVDGGGGGFQDVGHCVIMDSSGNTYVGGSIATSGANPTPIILKIANGSTTPVQFFASGLNSPSEILGLACLPNGTLYATGYETVTTPNQGKNLILLKFASDGTLVWKRTYTTSGTDNERGITVVLTTLPSPQVIVVGQGPLTNSDQDILVLSFAQ